MNIDWEFCERSNCFEHRNADSDVRYETSVHNIEVKLIYAGFFDSRDGIGEMRKIGSEK